jgi:4-hydroxyproline epimerase
MCGHGTIGLAVTLARRGNIGPGEHWLETPVGEISFVLHNNHRVSIANVPSYRFRKDVAVAVEGIGEIVGDIAWGGNWFFLVGQHGQQLSVEHADHLTDYCWKIRQALQKHGICGENGGEIDHIELFGPPSDPAVADSRNFVLCPGKAYDRSPCGTGTSAKLACLYTDGRLSEDQVWRQESIIGSVFEGSVQLREGQIIPTITGSAYVSAESRLVLEPEDPFVYGISW